MLNHQENRRQKHCYAYTRISVNTPEAEAIETVKTHKSVIDAWIANPQNNAQLSHFDSDIRHSSILRMHKRPGLSNTLIGMMKGDIFLAYSFFSIAQTYGETLKIIEYVEKINCHCIFIKEEYDNQTIAGNMLMQTSSCKIENKRLESSIRLIGTLISDVPFGWRRYGMEDDCGIYEEPGDQEVLRLIAELLQISSYDDIAKYLNTTGLVSPENDSLWKIFSPFGENSPKNALKWTPNTVKRIHEEANRMFAMY
jgi:hypothetical protein